MTLLADLRRFLAGEFERPDADDRRIPLASRAAGTTVACAWLHDDIVESRRVRFGRRGEVVRVDTLPDLTRMDGQPPWSAIAELSRCRRITLVVDSDAPLRRATNFSAPASVFQGALASRPESIAGPLPPGRSVAGFRHPSRPLALLREGIAGLADGWAADAAGHGLQLLRVQDSLLAALEAALRDPASQGVTAVVVAAPSRLAIVPIDPDGSWDEPILEPCEDPGAIATRLDAIPGPLLLARLVSEDLAGPSPADFHAVRPTSWPIHPSLLACLR